MIDINDLRFSAANSVRDLALLPSEVLELLDRLEAAESDAAHQKALADSALRVAEGWEEKCNSLRAKIAEMERQEPVMWANSSNINSSRINRERGGCGDQHTCSETQTTYHDTQLYALPGAQPAPRIPDDVMRDAKRYRFLRAAKNIPISTEAARDPIVYDAAIDAAMLAAAQEAKP